MKSLYDPATHLMQPSKTSSASNGLNLVESLAKRGVIDTHKHHRLFPRLLTVIHKLMVRPCY